MWDYIRVTKLLNLCRLRYLMKEISFEDKCAREQMIYTASGWTDEVLWAETCRRLDAAMLHTPAS